MKEKFLRIKKQAQYGFVVLFGVFGVFVSAHTDSNASEVTTSEHGVDMSAMDTNVRTANACASPLTDLDYMESLEHADENVLFAGCGGFL